MKTTITEFQVVDHGLECADYFQGCGIAFTKFDNIVTGCGDNFGAAMDDALECMAQQYTGIDFPAFEQAIKDHLGIASVSWPNKPSAFERDPDGESELYYYVSIRYNVHESTEFLTDRKLREGV